MAQIVRKNFRGYINIVDTVMVLFILTLTLGISIYAAGRFLIYGKGSVRSYALESFVLGISGVYSNVVISSIIFIGVLILLILYFLSKSRSGSASEDNGNVAEIYFFLFLWLSAISSLTPHISHLTNYFGELGLTIYYEQSAIYFTVISVIFAVIFFTALNIHFDIGNLKALLGGHKYRTSLYIYSAIPAAAAVGVFTLLNTISDLYILGFFMIFLSIMVFIQRYGIVRGSAALFVVFGSEIVPNYFKQVTSPIYDIFLFAFLILGFISLLVPYKNYAEKSLMNKRSPDLDRNEDEMEGKGKRESETNPNYVTGSAAPPQKASGIKDSREMADILFIRGTCPHCDSVEFYQNQDGTLTCKKCKSVLTGHETEFNSFNISKGRRPF